MNRALVASILLALAALLVAMTGAASGAEGHDGTRVAMSGAADLRDVDLGNNITECPQAGMNTEPEPLARIERDLVWRLSDRGDDTRANTEYACFPQNETTIVVNPTNSRNIVGAQNDYRMGGAFNGINATTDGGRHWYDLIGPFPSVPNGETLDSAGDPALTTDREGTFYYASINFNRTDDSNGIWVNRSTNGGFTWSRGCAAIDASSPPNPSDDVARCGGPGDPRHARRRDGLVAARQRPRPERQRAVRGQGVHRRRTAPGGVAADLLRARDEDPVAARFAGLPGGVDRAGPGLRHWTRFDSTALRGSR